MTIARVGKIKFRKARFEHGICIYCFKPILAGQYYIEHVGGTNSKPSGNAHKDCY